MPNASNSHPIYRPLLFSIIIMDISIPITINDKETMFNVELIITFCLILRRAVESNHSPNGPKQLSRLPLSPSRFTLLFYNAYHVYFFLYLMPCSFLSWHDSWGKVIEGSLLSYYCYHHLRDVFVI